MPTVFVAQLVKSEAEMAAIKSKKKEKKKEAVLKYENKRAMLQKMFSFVQIPYSLHLSIIYIYLIGIKPFL